MLATTGPLPRGDLRFEPKVDGWRTQVLLDGQQGRLRVLTRSGRRIEGSVPEMALLLQAVGERRMVLDGELVAGDGSPKSFYCLGPRLAATRAATVERAHQRDPVTLVIFGVLWLDNGPLLDWPYRERRDCLESLDLSGAHWTTILRTARRSWRPVRSLALRRNRQSRRGALPLGPYRCVADYAQNLF